MNMSTFITSIVSYFMIVILGMYQNGFLWNTYGALAMG